MPVQTGRIANILQGDRLCSLCDVHELGDKFYYMLLCKFFAGIKDTYILSPFPFQ